MLTAVFACASGPVVRETDTDRLYAQSEIWSDDAVIPVSKVMISQAFKGAWLTDFMARHPNQKPGITIGMFMNQTNRPISIKSFKRALKQAIIKSGRAVVIAGHQRLYKLLKHEPDPDYSLEGRISLFTDSSKAPADVYYQVILSFFDMKTGKRVWTGSKKLKIVTNQGK